MAHLAPVDPDRPPTHTLCSTSRTLGRAHLHRCIVKEQLLALVNDFGCLHNQAVLAQGHAALPLQHAVGLCAETGVAVDKAPRAGHDLEQLFVALRVHM